MKALAILCLLLAACQSPARKPTIPVLACPSMPDISFWLKPSPIAEPMQYSIDEATRVANARREALIRCNADKAEIAKALKQ